MKIEEELKQLKAHKVEKDWFSVAIYRIKTNKYVKIVNLREVMLEEEQN